MNPAIFMIIFGFFMLLAGFGLFYAIGVCSRCGKWSMSATCPGCNRCRYDYTD